MKRSSCLFLLPILVAGAGCPSTDNHVGSLGKDAGAAGGSGQVASDGPAQAADVAGVGQDAEQKPPAADGPISASICVTFSGQAAPCAGIPDAAIGNVCPYPPGSDTSSDTGKGNFVGCRPGPASNFCDQSWYTMTCNSAGTMPSSIPEPANSLACKVLPIPTPSNTLYYCCPCAPAVGVPDAGNVGQDAGQDAPEVGAAHQCQLNADGTCSAVTPDTSCLPVKGTLYDQEANCISNIGGTLYCTAWQTDAPGGLAPAVGCLQVPQDGGTLIYRTPESDISNPWWRSHECDLSLTTLVLDAAGCGSSSTDGPLSSGHTVPSDAVTPLFCNLNDGRQIPAGVAYTADDKCNYCICTSAGTGMCQAAG